MRRNREGAGGGLKGLVERDVKGFDGLRRLRGDVGLTQEERFA